MSDQVDGELSGDKSGMMSTTDRATGVEISRRYYEHVVRPLLDARWPGLLHAAGRLGAGSDVLGLDDDVSRDHDWGLRLSLFLPAELVGSVDAYLDSELPSQFAGLPTRFPFTGTTVPRHHVETQTLDGFLLDRLGFSDLEELNVEQWLSLTGQSVLEVSAGPVFYDATGELHAARSALAWYPTDVWTYIVGSCWRQLEEEMPLMGRAGQVGDERGSRLIGARLAGTAMQLTFLLHRTWAPYSKWIGSIFDRLPNSSTIGHHLDALLDAGDWRSRQAHMAQALHQVLELQHDAGLPAPAPATLPFWNRPFLFPNEAIASALHNSLTDPAVLALPRGRGNIEQITNNVAVLVHANSRLAMVDGS